MAKHTVKICLGTVKLGVPDYGFSSRQDLAEFDPLFFLAQVEAAGIHCFDTSPRYGQSENILGTYFTQAAGHRFISSKIDLLQAQDAGTPDKMFRSVQSSLQQLNLPRLDICYLHQNELKIISDPYVHEGLQLLKEQGLIGAAGASVYSYDECDYALDSAIFDVIQVPVSIFDLGFYQRFVKNNNSKVHFAARSMLLQGVMANPENIGPGIRQAAQVQEYLCQLDALANRYGLATIEMALGFAGSLSGLEHFLIGTTSVAHLEKNICYLNAALPKELLAELVELASLPKEWTNPRNWGG